MAEGLLDYLESFNRKERFFVVSTLLGTATLPLSPAFAAALSERVGVPVPVEPPVVLIDYHLDWLDAALLMAEGLRDREPRWNHRPSESAGESPRYIQANQEDVDLLVAFDQGDLSHVLLIEAKGATSWGNAQLKSKVDRLRLMFGEHGDARSGVRPHFVLMSPKESVNIATTAWPDWMKPGGKPVWMEMRLPGGRRRVERVDSDGTNVRPSASGRYFRVVRAAADAVEEPAP